MLLRGGGWTKRAHSIPQLLASCSDVEQLLQVLENRNHWKEVWAHCDSETFKTFSRRVCRDHLLQHLHL